MNINLSVIKASLIDNIYIYIHVKNPHILQCTTANKSKILRETVK